MKQVLVKIENITKRFGDNVVLNGLSLEVREGEVVVVVGPSGCGKSTLLRCINGLEPIQGGGITFRGERVDGSTRSIASIRQKVGMVFQNCGSAFPRKETAIPDSSRAGRSSAWRSCGHCACTLKSCCLMR